jgi:hypothetical protein
MVKPLIAIGSLLAGGTAVGTIAYIQNNPLAFTTRPDPSEEAVEIRPAPFDPVIGVVLSIPPEPMPLIRSKTPRPRAKIAARSGKLSSRPCSAWRDLGPKAVSTGTVEVRRVRTLCR